MTLTKSQLITTIQEELAVSRARSTELVETVLETIKRSLENGDDVLISGFGKFRVRNKEERIGRNPATDEALPISARRIVTFKCSGKLREKVNGKKR